MVNPPGSGRCFTHGGMSEGVPPIGVEALLVHRDWVRGLARSLVLDESRADDLAQEVWLTALRKPPRHGGSPKGWLATALRHRASNLRREEGRRRRHEEASARPEAAPPRDLVAEAEAQRAVVEAVLALEEPGRTTVLLRFFEGLTPSAIAARQGVPLETVRTRLRRSLDRRRERLDAAHGGDRRAWALVLAPLALENLPAIGNPLTGGLLMTMKAKAAVAAAVLLLVAGAAALLLPRPPAGEPPLADAPRSVPVSPAAAPAATASAPGPAEPPAAPVDSVLPVRPAPTATLVVRVVDLSTGAAVRDFTCGFESAGLHEGRADGETLRIELPLEDAAAPATVRCRLLSPVGREPVARDVPVRPGETVEVALALRSGDEVRGRVLGPEGTPVEGALVYLGTLVRLRGDEPFKPFRPERVKDGVRTDTAGAFALRGEGRWVSVWHPDFSPVTLKVEDVAEVRLPPRARLRGRLLDGAGGPASGVEVALDRDRKATTDGEGRFAFDGVEAGVRGLLLPGKRFVAVRVGAGEEAEVEVGAALPSVLIEVRREGKPFAGTLAGVLVGLDRVGSVVPFRLVDGRGTVEGVMAGRHVLLASSGLVLPVEIRGPEATAELGGGTLTVRAPAGTSLALAPSPADELVDLLALRAAHRAVPEGGSLEFAGLREGEFRILVEEGSGSGRVAEEKVVRVAGEGGTEAEAGVR